MYALSHNILKCYTMKYNCFRNIEPEFIALYIKLIKITYFIKKKMKISIRFLMKYDPKISSEEKLIFNLNKFVFRFNPVVRRILLNLYITGKTKICQILYLKLAHIIICVTPTQKG